MRVVVVVGVHRRIVPTGPPSGIAEGDSLLIERQRLQIDQRPQPVELFVRDDHIDTLRPRIDDAHGSVARLLHHVLQFGGEMVHSLSIPPNRISVSQKFLLDAIHLSPGACRPLRGDAPI